MTENNKHVVSHIDFNGDSIDIKDAVARQAASDASKAVSELTKNVVTDIAQGISDYTIRVTKNGLAVDVPIKGLSSKLDELTEAIGGSGGSGGNISLDSPEFTGIPKAPTAASGSDTTQIANTKFVQSELAARSTKVEKSSTNGNIKINGTETIVYTHPGSGTNPHGTTKSDVGLGNVGNFKAVSTVASQGLSDAEKSNARANIGAGTSSFSGSYKDLSNKPTIPTKVGELTNDKDYATKTEVTKAIDSIEIGERDLIPNIASNWQEGNWDEFSGSYSNHPGRICTKVGLKVSPGETYSMKIYLNGLTDKHLLFRTYGSDGSFIGSVVGITKLIYTVPSNVYELRFVVYEHVTLNDLTNGAVRVNVEKGSKDIIDLSMLGWIVPEDCPIQNEVNGTQFIQKVGRVDIGTLQLAQQLDPTRSLYHCSVPNIKPESSRDTAINGYCYGWTAVSRALHWEDGMFSYYSNSSDSNVVFITTHNYADVDAFKQAMKGQYLYYELATPITTTIDGNEIGETVSDVRKETTVNLLPVSLSSTSTKNGVTFTKNGDGTYTLTGTATDEAHFVLCGNIIRNISNKLPLKLLGGISNNVYVEYVNTSDDSKSIADKGTGGAVINNANNHLLCITVLAGETLPNVVIKPMLTTNLDATYDDFVPYTGSTGQINSDVADIKSALDGTADTILYDKSANTLYLKSGSTVLSSTEIKSGGATITPKPTVNPQIENSEGRVIITWEDPTDVTYDGSILPQWAGTKLVMKEDGYPTSPDDGILLVDNTTRDKYKTAGFTKDGLTNDKQYYFVLFPYSTDDVYNYDSGNRLLGEPAEEFKIVTFAGGTDEQIAKMIQAHYNDTLNIADYWAVGDTRTVSLSAMSATGVGESHRAQTVQFVIGDFDHDDLETPINGHSKAAVTILQKDCLMDASNASNPVNGLSDSERGYMKSSNPNYGGWKDCARRTWCNNVYFSALPSTWQSIVKTVNKKSETGGSSSSGTAVTTDKIFLAAGIEIFGPETFSHEDEGTQYQYYKNATANRYKMPKYTSSYVSGMYWERSTTGGSSNSFCCVSGDGIQYYDSSSSTNGIAPCLCI